jgi:hypothetical protein
MLRHNSEGVAVKIVQNMEEFRGDQHVNKMWVNVFWTVRFGCIAC